MQHPKTSNQHGGIGRIGRGVEPNALLGILQSCRWYIRFTMLPRMTELQVGTSTSLKALTFPTPFSSRYLLAMHVS